MLTHMYRIAVLFLLSRKNASLTNQLMRQHRERKQIFQHFIDTVKAAYTYKLYFYFIITEIDI